MLLIYIYIYNTYTHAHTYAQMHASMHTHRHIHTHTHTHQFVHLVCTIHKLSLYTNASSVGRLQEIAKVDLQTSMPNEAKEFEASNFTIQISINQSIFFSACNKYTFKILSNDFKYSTSVNKLKLSSNRLPEVSAGNSLTVQFQTSFIQILLALIGAAAARASQK